MIQWMKFKSKNKIEIYKSIKWYALIAVTIRMYYYDLLKMTKSSIALFNFFFFNKFLAQIDFTRLNKETNDNFISQAAIVSKQVALIWCMCQKKKIEPKHVFTKDIISITILALIDVQKFTMNQKQKYTNTSLSYKCIDEEKFDCSRTAIKSHVLFKYIFMTCDTFRIP